MKTYRSMNEAWVDVICDILSTGHDIGSRDGACREMAPGYAFKLATTDYALLTHPGRALSPAFVAAELLWYLGGNSETTMLEHYAPSYGRFATPGTKTAHGAYGARIGDADPSFSRALGEKCDALAGQPACTQVAAVIALLKKSKDTRQALLSMWNAGDLLYALEGKTPDIPCTVCLQFFARRDQLHCVAYMRSNDVWLGMPHDVFSFTRIQQFIAASVGLEAGTYTHCVGSMHLYDRNADKAHACLQIASAPDLSVKTQERIPVSIDIIDAIRGEEACRTSQWASANDIIDKLKVGSLAYELLAAVMPHYDPAVEHCITPAFKELWRQAHDRRRRNGQRGQDAPSESSSARAEPAEVPARVSAPEQAS